MRSGEWGVKGGGASTICSNLFSSEEAWVYLAAGAGCLWMFVFVIFRGLSSWLVASDCCRAQVRPLAFHQPCYGLHMLRDRFTPPIFRLRSRFVTDQAPSEQISCRWT